MDRKKGGRKEKGREKEREREKERDRKKMKERGKEGREVQYPCVPTRKQRAE